MIRIGALAHRKPDTAADDFSLFVDTAAITGFRTGADFVDDLLRILRRQFIRPCQAADFAQDLVKKLFLQR